MVRRGGTFGRSAVPDGRPAGSGPKSRLHLHQEGVEGVTGATFVDGEVECVKAVRKQVGAGADWIKVSSVF